MDPSFKPYFLMGKFMYGILLEFSMKAVQLIQVLIEFNFYHFKRGFRM